VDAAFAQSTPQGGVARLESDADVQGMDPARVYDPRAWQLLDATCVKLFNYPDRPAPAGSQLEPEVAESLPQVSPDGRTYTIRIRPGFRFSSGEPVTAQTFRFAIDLRHTYATFALRAGVSVFAVSRVMGSSIAMID
jgi:ABC-type transport system substrate-binding protein